MKILVTGAKGFMGRNLIAALQNLGPAEIVEYDLDGERDTLEAACADAGFVFHLAGINRPESEQEFVTGNMDFTERLLSLLRQAQNTAPVLFSSTIQATRDNPYGRSKSRAEELVFAHAVENASPVYVYRLPNVFGKWCKPNYNSVVATFCYNVSRGIALRVDDPETELRLVYIDDVVGSFAAAMNGAATHEGKFCVIPTEHRIKLGELAAKLLSFQAGREKCLIPPLFTAFDRALYATWLSYLPQESLAYCLDLKTDERGCLAEFIKSAEAGQIFFSKTKAGITRGNHWHHSKCEKFFVVSGNAAIQLREINGSKVIRLDVCGDDPQVVDIPPGFTHSITNTGTDELLTLFWANEIFDPEQADTYYLKVDNHI